MTHRETNLRHLWLAGLGLMAKVRRKVESIAANQTKAPPTTFVTTEKVAKRAVRKVASSGSRKAGEVESKRRIAAKGK